MPDAFVDLPYPLKGIDLSSPFGEQPVLPLPDGSGYARSTALGLNVRAFEPSTATMRGGARPGLTKYIDQQVSGSNLIQNLDVVITTAATALATGGGFQPNPAANTGLQLWVGYSWTSQGFTLSARLLSDYLAKSATLIQDTPIFYALDHPPDNPIDFSSSAAGYQLRVTVTDQLSNTVTVSAATTQTLAMHTASGVTYLGLPATDYAWTTMYSSNPGSRTYSVRVQLLGSNGDPVQKANGNGVAISGQYVEETFSTAQTITAWVLWKQTVSLSASFNLAINLDTQAAPSGSTETNDIYATATGLLAQTNAVSPNQQINWRRVPMLVVNSGTPPYSAVTTPANPYVFPQGAGAYAVTRTLSAAYASQQTVYSANASPTAAMFATFYTGAGISAYANATSGTAVSPSLNTTTLSVAWRNATIHSTSYRGLGDLGPTGVPSPSTGIVTTPDAQTASFSPNYQTNYGWFKNSESHTPSLVASAADKATVVTLIQTAVSTCLQSYTQQFAGQISSGLALSAVVSDT